MTPNPALQKILKLILNTDKKENNNYETKERNVFGKVDK